MGIHDSMHLVQGEGSVSSFEQVQAATDPTDIGLTPSTPPLVPQTTSIEFNGVNHGSKPEGLQEQFGETRWSTHRA